MKDTNKLAISFTERLSPFPMLKALHLTSLVNISSLVADKTLASTTSSTYVKSLYCSPLPLIVIGSPFNNCCAKTPITKQ